jgi:hypothetical protein
LWSSQWSLTFWISHQYPICIPLLPHLYYVPCSSQHPWLDHSNYSCRRVQVSSSLYTFLQPPVTSSLFSPNILFSTLFSNTLSVPGM